MPRSGLALAIGFPALGLFLMIAVLFSLREERDDGQLRHALDVEVDLGDLLTSLLDAEVGQRGYLLTGDKLFLKPYETATARIDGLLTHLEHTVRHDPEQVAEVAEIGGLIERKRAELAETITLRDSGDASGAIDLVRTRSGLGFMDGIRAIVARMNAEQERLYQGQKASAKTIAQVTSLLTAVALVLMGLLGIAAFSEMRKRARLARFLPVEVAHRLAEDDQGLRDGRSVSATIAFIDIRGSTAMAETMAPTDLSRLLTGFRAAVSSAARQHGGMVDKFIGDGALVVFGALDGDDRAPAKALAFAEDLLGRLKSTEAATARLRVGIGLHCGEVVCGIVGDADRQEFTVLGDTVNVASRIEAATKTHDTDLLVSAAILERAGADPSAWHEVEGRQVRGHRGTIVLYKPRRSIAPALTYGPDVAATG